jgi:7-carboxy-7-deazaguanine synthase
MAYSIKELFFTLQGEGAHVGRPAVFCRFAGCNLWSGHESDRKTAICNFCDTDFVGTDGPGGGYFRTAGDLATAVFEHWPNSRGTTSRPFVVCTGGEPLLQLDQEAVDALHQKGFEIAIETNGTKTPPLGIDWICCSPKPGTDLVITRGDELKLVFPQPNMSPVDFECLDFKYFYLQPMDSSARSRNVDLALEYCLNHPQWRLCLQTQKLLCIR